MCWWRRTSPGRWWGRPGAGPSWRCSGWRSGTCTGPVMTMLLTVEDRDYTLRWFPNISNYNITTVRQRYEGDCLRVCVYFWYRRPPLSNHMADFWHRDTFPPADYTDELSIPYTHPRGEQNWHKQIRNINVGSTNWKYDLWSKQEIKSLVCQGFLTQSSLIGSEWTFLALDQYSLSVFNVHLPNWTLSLYVCLQMAYD